MPRKDLENLKHLSHSQIDRLRQCPAQWEFSYVKKIPVTGSPNFIVGTAYHGAIEQAFRFKLETGEDTDPELVEELVHSEWEKFQKYTEMDWKGEDENQLLELTNDLAYKYVKEWLPGIMPKLVEKEYHIPINEEDEEGNVTPTGYTFVLRLDLMDVKGIIYDHKTAKNMMHYSQAEADRNPQASATAFALNSGIVFYNHVALKYKTPKIVAVRTYRTVEDVDWYKKMLPKYVKMVKSGIFPPNDSGWWCSPLYCDYYDICRPGLRKTISLIDDG